MPPVGTRCSSRRCSRWRRTGDEVRVPPTLQHCSPPGWTVSTRRSGACSNVGPWRATPSRHHAGAGRRQVGHARLASLVRKDHRAAQSADRRRRRLPISPPAAATRPRGTGRPARIEHAGHSPPGSRRMARAGEHRELIGHHLEQACHYRAELGLPDDPEPTSRAARHLAAAGRRALRRSDYAAAAPVGASGLPRATGHP